MNDVITQTAAEADEVLSAFAQAGRGADLAAWTRRHPEHARALARLAAAQRLPVAAEASVNPAADERVRQIGQSVVAAARARAAQVAAAASPPRPVLSSLALAAKARALTPNAVAAALDLPVACFWKLHRRLFAPDSLPQTLIAALADLLGQSADEIAAYLRQPPTLAAGASYRADAAPALGAQEPFAAALARDPALTNAGRARWLGPAASASAE